MQIVYDDAESQLDILLCWMLYLVKLNLIWMDMLRWLFLMNNVVRVEEDKIRTGRDRSPRNVDYTSIQFGDELTRQMT